MVASRFLLFQKSLVEACKAVKKPAHLEKHAITEACVFHGPICWNSN